jgi:hypothetical protein
VASIEVTVEVTRFAHRSTRIDCLRPAACPVRFLLELGNHTYSHGDLNRVPLEAFQADLIRGEIVTRKLMEAKGRGHSIACEMPARERVTDR